MAVLLEKKQGTSSWFHLKIIRWPVTLIKCLGSKNLLCWGYFFFNWPVNYNLSWNAANSLVPVFSLSYKMGARKEKEKKKALKYILVVIPLVHFKYFCYSLQWLQGWATEIFHNWKDGSYARDASRNGKIRFKLNMVQGTQCCPFLGWQAGNAKAEWAKQQNKCLTGTRYFWYL